MKKFSQIMAALGLVSIVLHSYANEIHPDVIYGDDNRREILAAEEPAQIEVSRATLAIIPKDGVKKGDKNNYVKIVGRKFQEEFNLCPEEPYLEQTVAANCSGFLVSEDVIATAGHCVTPYDCQAYQYVFGYQNSATGEPLEQLPQEDVYDCKEVIHHRVQGTQDYALVRLDRPVAHRRALILQTSRVQPGDPIYVVGHPSGLPTKIATKAQVRKDFGDFFNANLDTYGGNSGSAVFNAFTHEVAGILVRGDEDFIYDEHRRCYVSHRCPDNGCRGEDVTSIELIRKALESGTL